MREILKDLTENETHYIKMENGGTIFTVILEYSGRSKEKAWDAWIDPSNIVSAPTPYEAFLEKIRELSS